jgi:hypothetical protein
MSTLTDVRLPGAQAPFGWVVARLEGPNGFARVDERGTTVRVAVGEQDGRSGEPAGSPQSLVTAVLGRRGEVVVETCSAPPALLVGADGTRLLPATPGLRRPTRMAAGDVLLLCSASALDAPPVGLVEILKAPAADVLGTSPETLLAMILGDRSDGAAAVVSRAGDA